MGWWGWGGMTRCPTTKLVSTELLALCHIFVPTCCSLTIFLCSSGFSDLVFDFHFLYTYPRISRGLTGRQSLRMPYYIWVIWVEPAETRDVSHLSKGLEDTVLVTEDSCRDSGLQGQWAVGTVGYEDSRLWGQWAIGTVG